MPATMRRSRGWFGIHLDFHATREAVVGGRTTPAMVERLLRSVRPDFLQIDCKGHPGYSSYPTTVGTRCAGYRGDPLRVWRRVTARHGVALVMHYSGVWDSAIVASRPEWARLDQDGKPDGNNTSVFSPYVDELVIPQMRELAEAYAVDAVWVDGDNWSTKADWSQWAIAAWRAAGHGDPPRLASDPQWHAYVDFCREGFRAFVRRYVDALHAAKPGFEVASNWGWSSFQPEPVAAAVDFLSGDLAGVKGFDAARWESRCLMHQGLPWDLMAWGFGAKHSEGFRHQSDKTAVQLCQEAAPVLVAGGGFQIYYTQADDGAMAAERLRPAAAVARFVRARRRLCQHATSVPQVMLVQSTLGHYRTIAPACFGYGQANPRMLGVLGALLDNQVGVDVLHTALALERMASFPLVVVPEYPELEPELIARLVEHARSGGSVLAFGSVACAALAGAGGVTLGATASDDRWLRLDRILVRTAGPCTTLLPARGTTTLATSHEDADGATPGAAIATVRRIGRGRIVLAGFALGDTYGTRRSCQLRDLLGGLLKRLLPRPIASVAGCREVDLAAMRTADGRLAIHLIDSSGAVRSAEVFSCEGPRPTPPIALTIRCAKPRRVTWEPGTGRLAHTWRSGVLRVTVPPFAIHGAVVVEPQPA